MEKILRNPKRLITALLIGNNIANIAASVMATQSIIQFFERMGHQETALDTVLITAVLTILILIFGEITPKTLALKDPERYCIFIAKPVYFLLILFGPLIGIFIGFSGFIAKSLGLSSYSHHILTEEELKTALEIGEEEGILEEEEREMIHSIFEFSKTLAREVMTPRPDAVCIPVSASVSDCITLIQKKGHTRIPVFEGRIDNILGVIYAKDLLGIETPQTVQVKSVMRDPVFIPETKPLESVFDQMKKSKLHLAIVVDEHGGMSGIITLEDVIEEIIGDIQDEYDVDEHPEFTDLGDGHYLVDAGMSIDDLADKIQVDFPRTEDYDTIGGFVLSILGKLPKVGDELSYDHLLFVIKDIDKQRIKQIEILKTDGADDAEADTARVET